VSGCDSPVDVAVEDDASLQRNDHAAGAGHSGVQLFDSETFDGNGRTCVSCHLDGSGAISPADIADAFADDPTGPLFRAIDSDDGTGSSYNRLLNDATFLVTIDLPENVVLADDPAARSITLARGASTTLNNPGFETVLMQDGRNSTLEGQAHGAVNAHYGPGRQPTEPELAAIADFERNNLRFYSSPQMLSWSNGGPAVELPAATTDEEARGRVWFESTPEGVCAHCHGGPLLNETNEHILAPVPPGTRFFTAFVSDFNTMGNDVFTFEFYDAADPAAPPTVVVSPDPGRALISGHPADANFFRIPTIWGSKHTAPYFHDNSAADLQELMDHYQVYFGLIGIPMTEQDKIDVIAYMQLLE
jgi:cytochrome c peroxidase